MTPTPDQIRQALSDLRGAVRVHVPLERLTHVRIGGTAACFVEPFHEEDVAAAVRVCHELDVPLRVLGGGSNLLVSDEEVPGVVMDLRSLNRIVRDEERLTAGAGVSLPSLLRGARESGLAGLEQLTGIPATVGGAVAMNAGTRQGETFDSLVSLTLVDRDGEICVRGKDAFAPRYRDGGLGDAIVVHATFALTPDAPPAIYERFESYLKSRNASQPVTEHSVGCVFTNPNGDAAGRLIETSDCKLMRRGGVSVSGRHANYFVNDKGGTAADFLELLRAVRARVLEVHGVELIPEVKFWNCSPD